MEGPKCVESSDDYLVEFDGTEDRGDLVSTAMQEDTKMVEDVAGFVDLLDGTDVDVNRVALTESGQVDLYYSPRGDSPRTLGNDIEEAAIQFAAIYAEDGSIRGLQAAGELDDGEAIRWHIQRSWAAQCAREKLDPARYVRTVADTARTEVRE